MSTSASVSATPQSKLVKLVYDKAIIIKEAASTQKVTMSIMAKQDDSTPASNSTIIVKHIAGAISSNSKELPILLASSDFNLILPIILNAAIAHGCIKVVDILLPRLETDLEFQKLMVRLAIRGGHIDILLLLTTWDVNALNIAIAEKNELIIDVLLSHKDYVLSLTDIIAAARLDSFRAIMSNVAVPKETFKTAVFVMRHLGLHDAVKTWFSVSNWVDGGMREPSYCIPKYDSDYKRNPFPKYDADIKPVVSAEPAEAKSVDDVCDILMHSVLTDVQIYEQVNNARTIDKTLATKNQKLGELEIKMAIASNIIGVVKSLIGFYPGDKKDLLKFAISIPEIHTSMIRCIADIKRPEPVESTEPTESDAPTESKPVESKPVESEPTESDESDDKQKRYLKNAITKNNADVVAWRIKHYTGDKTEMLKFAIATPGVDMKIIKIIAGTM